MSVHRTAALFFTDAEPYNCIPNKRNLYNA